MTQSRSVCLLFRRCLHIGQLCASAEKSNLAKLRKKTGFSFINCKDALQRFNNDLVKAEEWLHEQAEKQGWSKATRLEGRETAQGLIAVICEDNYATMVEVNCETDFVARNSQFQNFVGKVASMALRQHRTDNPVITQVGKMNFTGNELNDLKSNEDSNVTLQDFRVKAISMTGENITVRRAVCMHVPNGHILGNYVHSMAQISVYKSNDCSLGKYGALIAAHNIKQKSPKFQAEEFGRRLCQHIVGMKPLTIGEYSRPTPSESQVPVEDGEQVGESIATDLVNQEYLTDSSLTVGELLYQEDIVVTDFVRYECGQTLD